jgi:hypothetical protein
MRLMFVTLASAIAVGGSFAHAGDIAVTAGLELGGVTLKDTDPEIDNTFGARAHADFTMPIFSEDGPLRFGFGLSIEGAYEEGNLVDPFDDDDHFFSQVTLFTPEMIVAWSQPLGEKFFLEPSVAFGLPIGYWSTGKTDHHHHHDDFDVDDDDTRIGVSVRPGIALGYNINQHHAVGISASYMFAHIDFDDGIGPWACGQTAKRGCARVAPAHPVSGRFASLREEPLDRVHGRLALDRRDAFEQGDFLRADLDAVAGLAAVGDAALFHQGV